MAFLEAELGFPAQSPVQKTVVCLWGLAGVGKSQLAARFVHQQLSNHPRREIFWISGENQASFEQSVIAMLKSKLENNDIITSHPTPEGERSALVDLFFAELNRLVDGRWLLIVDGLNQSTSPTGQKSPIFDVHRYIRGLTRGYVLLTSRRRDVVERYHPIWELKGLKDEDATSLLLSQIPSHSMQGMKPENGATYSDPYSTISITL